jgi:1,4-dihydroxy-2-naphthoate octaprenyltransferase
MRLASVALILQGVFSILSLWGILVCWIPFWMASLLSSAIKSVTTAFETDDSAEMQNAMDKIAKYFRVFGILTIVMIIVFFLGIFAAILIPAIVKARHAAMEAGAQ